MYNKAAGNKNCCVSMPSDFYETCIEICGERNFSSWVRTSLQAEVDKHRAIPGQTPGGTCRQCGQPDAWYRNSQNHTYWCKICFSKVTNQHIFADKTPRTPQAGQREVLLQAVVRAAKALVEYDTIITEPLPHSP